MTRPTRIPGHLLRWDDAGEPVREEWRDLGERFELTPKGAAERRACHDRGDLDGLAWRRCRRKDGDTLRPVRGVESTWPVGAWDAAERGRR
jgi:hypothetical protein